MSVDDAILAAAVLTLAGAWCWGTLTNKDDAACTGCRRRGCGRRPAGQGCDHEPPEDGSKGGISTTTGDEDR